MDCLIYIPCCQKVQFQTLKSQTWDTRRQKYVNTKVYHHYYKHLQRYCLNLMNIYHFTSNVPLKLLQMAENIHFNHNLISKILNNAHITATFYKILAITITINHNTK